jgi:hypothetical protein
LDSLPPSATVVGTFVDVEVVLQEAPARFLSQLPYLGGVLHGTISQSLHGAPLASQAMWRLVAPPRRFMAGQAGADVQWLSDAGTLRFGVILHSADTTFCQQLLLAVKGMAWLGSGAERHRVAQVRCLSRGLPVPGVLAGPLSGLQVAQVQLTWLTPLHMASRAQVAAGHALEPPTLLRIVRSLARRASEWQPQWAQQLGIGSPAWTGAEEQVRQAQSLENDVHPLRWHYGSRTKPNPHERLGLMGTQRFEARLSPAVESLLRWGPWLGVGEGATYGCGGYELRVNRVEAA